MKNELLERLKENLEAAMVESREGKSVRSKPVSEPSKPPETPSNILPRPTNGEALLLTTPDDLEVLKAHAAAFSKYARGLGISFITVATVNGANGGRTHLCSYNMTETASSAVGALILALDPVYAVTGLKCPIENFVNVE